MSPQVWSFRKCLQHSAVGLILFGILALPSIAADRYVIDPSHTYSIFEYSHWGLSLQQGRFEKNSGFIELDLEKKTENVAIAANDAIFTIAAVDSIISFVTN